MTSVPTRAVGARMRCSPMSCPLSREDYWPPFWACLHVLTERLTVSAGKWGLSWGNLARPGQQGQWDGKAWTPGTVALTPL